MVEDRHLHIGIMPLTPISRKSYCCFCFQTFTSRPVLTSPFPCGSRLTRGLAHSLQKFTQITKTSLSLLNCFRPMIVLIGMMMIVMIPCLYTMSLARVDIRLCGLDCSRRFVMYSRWRLTAIMEPGAMARRSDMDAAVHDFTKTCRLVWTMVQ